LGNRRTILFRLSARRLFSKTKKLESVSIDYLLGEMISAKLENGIQIILDNGEWICDDPALTEKLNCTQNYWRAKDDGFYPDSGSQDLVAAAKVLAQFGGEVTFVTSDRCVDAQNEESVY